jgi:RNA polymerase sigma-70 factor (ECF subfamily)
MQTFLAPRVPADLRPIPPPPDSEVVAASSALQAVPRTRSGIFPIAPQRGGVGRRPTPPALDASSDDVRLVRAALGGHPGAHVAIWRKYVGLVRSKIGRMAGSHDVDDHVQEVFSRLFERLGELRDPAALRSFIIGIALRVVGTELRRRRCRHWLLLTATGDLPDVPGPWADDGSDAREMLARFVTIMDRLTPHSARVFELRYVEQKELVDVAAAMGISLATAKRHLARASARVFAMAERDAALAGFVHGGPEAYDAAS